MKKIIVLFVMTFSLMSFAESEITTVGFDVLEKNDYTSFDVEYNFGDGDTYELTCSATVTYNGEVRETFTFAASTSGGISNACLLASAAAMAYIAAHS